MSDTEKIRRLEQALLELLPAANAAHDYLHNLITGVQTFDDVAASTRAEAIRKARVVAYDALGETA